MINQSQQRLEGECNTCALAINLYNVERQDHFDLFLVCPRNHVLCAECYKMYRKNIAKGGSSVCPFGCNSTLDLVNPVRGLRFGDQYVIMKREYNSILEESRKHKIINQQIHLIRNNCRQLGQQLNRLQTQERGLLQIDEDVSYFISKKQEKKKQLQKLDQLTKSRKLRQFITFLVLDTFFSLLQIVSTVLQLLNLFQFYIWFKRFEAASFILYFIICELTVVLLQFKLPWQIKQRTNFKSALYLIFVILSPISYLKLVFTNQIVRWGKYFNQNQQVSKPLTFQYINYFFLAGKNTLFIQYHIRYHFINNPKSDLNSIVFSFTVIEYFALIACDIAYYRLTRKQKV